MAKRKRYDVLIGKEWLPCRVANLLPSGWLEWTTYDGTTGLSRPGKFRERATT